MNWTAVQVIKQTDSSVIRAVLSVVRIVDYDKVDDFKVLVDSDAIEPTDWFMYAARSGAVRVLDAIIERCCSIVKTQGCDALREALLCSRSAVVRRLIGLVDNVDGLWYTAAIGLPVRDEEALTAMTLRFEPSPLDQVSVIEMLCDRKRWHVIKTLLEMGWSLKDCNEDVRSKIGAVSDLESAVRAAAVRDEMKATS